VRAERSGELLGLLVLCAVLYAPPALALPSWLTDLNVTLPSRPAQPNPGTSTPMQGDEPAVAVVLYAQTTITVEPSGKLLRRQRTVLQILRPDGVRYGTTQVLDGPERRVIVLRGWCQTPEGKQLESRAQDIIDTSPQAAMETDRHLKMLHMQGAAVGSIVAFDVEQEFDSSQWIDDWRFQDIIPVEQAHLLLQLPADWGYQASWLKHSPVAPVARGPGRWEWVVDNVPGVQPEQHMPALQGIAGRAALSVNPPAGKHIDAWNDVGSWYSELTEGRRMASPEIKQQVAELTAASPTIVAKMQALTEFVQQNIRYLAIELGIGAYQPRPAAEVFSHRYGDCKDKATLMSAMLQEIGVDSYYVIVNTGRGVISDSTPPGLGFNHVILAIRLPDGVEDESFGALVKHAKLGPLLIFDPTNEFIPLGSLSGSLQGNFGLLVAPGVSELIQLPRLPSRANAIKREATMTLDGNGTLRGDVQESWIGEAAAMQRTERRLANRATDQIKPVEAQIASSFASVEIIKAAVDNLQRIEQPVTWRYSLQAGSYAKVADNLLILRPRILGSKTTGFLETGRPRELPIELACPEEDTDKFEITLPAGYVSDFLPPAVDLDYPFGSYHSKTELAGNVLRYSRTFTLKESSIPADQAEDLRHFYRIINTDERASAVLKRAEPTLN
jgi:Domain of Unknown Function with PDB structure (DUF3857)/Transglutaminase-like superfamily